MGFTGAAAAEAALYSGEAYAGVTAAGGAAAAAGSGLAALGSGAAIGSGIAAGMGAEAGAAGGAGALSGAGLAADTVAGGVAASDVLAGEGSAVTYLTNGPGVAAGAAPVAAGGGSGLLGQAETAAITSGISKLFNPTPERPSVPPVTPMPDPMALEEAKKKSIIDQLARRGRASTILSQPSGGKLGS